MKNGDSEESWGVQCEPAVRPRTRLARHDGPREASLAADQTPGQSIVHSDRSSRSAEELHLTRGLLYQFHRGNGRGRFTIPPPCIIPYYHLQEVAFDMVLCDGMPCSLWHGSDELKGSTVVSAVAMYSRDPQFKIFSVPPISCLLAQGEPRNNLSLPNGLCPSEAALAACQHHYEGACMPPWLRSADLDMSLRRTLQGTKRGV